MPNTIDMKEATIFNALGQKVGVSTMKNIPVSQLSNGMYSLQINTSEGSFHKNFIKK